jgi:hypothetical protein
MAPQLLRLLGRPASTGTPARLFKLVGMPVGAFLISRQFNQSTPQPQNYSALPAATLDMASVLMYYADNWSLMLTLRCGIRPGGFGS